MPPIGVYMHIPFCLSKCPYCDFYSVPYEEPLADAYTEALLRAIRGQPFGALEADTLYIGGGTPCLLGAERLAMLVEAARLHLGLRVDAEVTVEANPGAVTAAELQALREAGFNRVSFGVQSALDAELALLGRIHGAAEAKEAVLAAHDAGFAHISADLMLAIPGQTRESLRESVEFLCALPVDHLSAYLLKIEEKTPFFSRYGQEKAALPDEDTAAELYLDCVALLEAHGFLQYEISNFAKNGAVSRHNLKYWRLQEYLGIGAAAHSFVHGKRFYLPPDLHALVAAEDPFALAVQDGTGGGAQEALLLGLRLCEGVDTAALQARYGLDPLPLLERASAPALRGLVRVEGTRLSLTPRGFLLSNSVILSLIEQLF